MNYKDYKRLAEIRHQWYGFETIKPESVPFILELNESLQAALAAAQGERDEALYALADLQKYTRLAESQCDRLRAALEAAPAPGEEPGWRYKAWRKWYDTTHAEALKL